MSKLQKTIRIVEKTIRHARLVRLEKKIKKIEKGKEK